MESKHVSGYEGLAAWSTAQELSEFLKLSDTTIYREEKKYRQTKGRYGLRARRFGTAVRFYIDDVVEWSLKRWRNRRGPLRAHVAPT